MSIGTNEGRIMAARESEVSNPVKNDHEWRIKGQCKEDIRVNLLYQKVGEKFKGKEHQRGRGMKKL